MELMSRIHEYTDYFRPTLVGLTIEDFAIQPQESRCLTRLEQTLFRYFCLKEANTGSTTLPGYPSFLSHVCYDNDSETGKVVYVDLLSLPADSKDTILKVLNNIHKIFIERMRNKWLMVVGDAKTYDILQDLKKHYGSKMDWLLPFPGDWHILYNYQKVLLKIYGDAGLLQLAKVAGHRSETLTSLALASHFKRTHRFLLQSFEAISRTLLSKYIQSLESSSTKARLVEAFRTSAGTFADKLSSISTSEELSDLIGVLETSFQSGDLHKFSSGFAPFLSSICLKQDTVLFWHDYITKNCLAYIALYTAMRNGDWFLRIAAIKTMAAIFSAYDRPIYQVLVPQHLADMLSFPPTVLHHLKKGAISVRLTKTTGHAVGLDELHEMKINRDAKFAIVRPSDGLIDKMANYMPFRAGCMNNLKHHLGLGNARPTTLPIPTSRDRIADDNIKAMLDHIKESKMLPDSEENEGLQNFLSGVRASPEQAQDLLHFRTIGQQEYEAHISYRILRTPSTDDAPHRKKSLKTFTTTTSARQRNKQVERERKIHNICMKKQMVMLARGDTLPVDYTTTFNPLPAALIDPVTGSRPYKGSKCKTTDFLETRYSRSKVIVHTLPPQWHPEAVLLEGMFLIQTPPMPGIVNFQEYAEMLFDCFALPHLKAGAKEVHILYDNPGQVKESPKHIERTKRDEKCTVRTNHKCDKIKDSTLLPGEWNTNLINCRSCKRELCNYLSQAMLTVAPNSLSPRQTFITAGGFTGDRLNQRWSVTHTNQPQSVPELMSSVEETDQRIWYHCVKSAGYKKLLYSPDTDVYHIGLAITQDHLPGSDVFVQLKGRKKNALGTST